MRRGRQVKRGERPAGLLGHPLPPQSRHRESRQLPSDQSKTRSKTPAPSSEWTVLPRAASTRHTSRSADRSVRAAASVSSAPSTACTPLDCHHAPVSTHWATTAETFQSRPFQRNCSGPSTTPPAPGTSPFRTSTGSSYRRMSAPFRALTGSVRPARPRTGLAPLHRPPGAHLSAPSAMLSLAAAPGTGMGVEVTPAASGCSNRCSNALNGTPGFRQRVKPRISRPGCRVRSSPMTRAPQIDPLRLDRLDDGDPADLAKNADLDSGRFDGLHLTRLELPGATVTSSRFTGLDADEADLRGARLSEVELDRVHLPVVRAARVQWRDVRLNGRIGGLESYEAQCRSVHVDGCKIDYLNLRGAELTDVAFSDCLIGELDLLTAVARRVRFDNARIGRLNVQHAKLHDVDLRGASLDAVDGVTDLGGAT